MVMLSVVNSRFFLAADNPYGSLDSHSCIVGKKEKNELIVLRVPHGQCLRLLLHDNLVCPFDLDQA